MVFSVFHSHYTLSITIGYRLEYGYKKSDRRFRHKKSGDPIDILIYLLRGFILEKIINSDIKPKHNKGDYSRGQSFFAHKFIILAERL